MEFGNKHLPFVVPYVNSMKGGIYMFLYYVTPLGQAVLLDYTGDDRIIVLPDEIDGHEVHPQIPDNTFANCKNVEYIVCQQDVTFGLFLFQNCPKLKAVVSLDCRPHFEEFSFTGPDFTPKDVSEMEIISDYYFEDYEADWGGNVSRAKALLIDTVQRLAQNNDTYGLRMLARLSPLGVTLRNAVLTNHMDPLKDMLALEIPLGDDCPFAISINDAIQTRRPEVFRLLLQQGLTRGDYYEPYPIRLALLYNQYDMVKELLAGGHYPKDFVTHFWDAPSQSLLKYALTHCSPDIINMLVEAGARLLESEK